MRAPYSPHFVTFVVIFAALLALLAFPVLQEHGSRELKIVLIGGLGVALLGVLLFNARQRWSARAKGRTSDDEFSRLARLNAGHAAFMMSMVLWMAIFALQGLFDSTRTMLGIGILGQCGFYGIGLVYFNRFGSLHENKD